jgi:hypothetical protein
MRSITTRLVLALAVSLGVVVGAPVAAQADTVGCVTQAEFQRVHRGMSKTRVRHIFDTRGHRESVSSFGHHRDEFRSYRVCSSWGSPRWSDVSINFDNYSTRGRGMRVYSKSSFIMR